MRTATAADRAATVARRHIPLILRDLQRVREVCGVADCTYHQQKIDRLLDQLLSARTIAALGR